MNILLSWEIPLFISILTLIGIILIKFLFHRNHKLPEYQKLKRANFRLQLNEVEENGDESVEWRVNETIFKPHTFFFIAVSIGWTVAWTAWTYLATTWHYPFRYLRVFFIVLGIIVCIQLVISALHRPMVASRKEIAHFRPVVIIPMYNEHPELLMESIDSLFNQTVLPSEIHVVNDGSSGDIDYSEVIHQFERLGKTFGVNTSWTNQANGGKRAAQITGFAQITSFEDAIVVTMDSDGILSLNALEKGLMPFADSNVYSVAGMIVSNNVKKSLLARINEVIITNQQLIDRSFMSMFGTVPVNSGALALYRPEVIQEAIDHGYDEEVFAGTEVKFSDDSFLTVFAALKGKTVFQPNAIVFSDMPSKLGQHFRQQLRWSKGAFIRSFWRIHYFPATSMIFIRQAISWISFFTISFLLVQVVIYVMLFGTPEILLTMIAFLTVLSYIQALKYFNVQRYDMSTMDSIIVFLTAPLAMFWSSFVLRFVKIGAMISHRENKWGTREDIEEN